MAREGHYYRLYQAQARNVDTEADTEMAGNDLDVFRVRVVEGWRLDAAAPGHDAIGA